MPGKILLKLPVGNYTFVDRARPGVSRTRDGHFTIEHFADDSKQIELRRFIDMAADGWWSGDLDVRRPARDIELLMAADDLHVAEVITWRNDKSPWGGQLPKQPLVRFDGNRYYHLLAGASARSGTELLLLNLPAPLKLPAADAEYPPVMKYLAEAREKGDLWVDASKPFWWDLPMLVAAGQIDSIEIAHSHICRDGTINDEADGKPRDRKRYPTVKGDAEWSQEIYFRLLECGLRIPPTAGSGSGESPNPVGYNRVYVHVDGELTYEKWWQQLRAGQVFVTNGPLMKPSVEGELPGHVFQADGGHETGAGDRPDPLHPRADQLSGDHQGRPRRAGGAVRRVRQERQAAEAHVRPQRLVPDPRGDRRAEDLPLRHDRAVLRRDRLPAADQQERGPVLPRLGLPAGQADQAGRSAAAAGSAPVAPPGAGFLAGPALEGQRGRDHITAK